jgi:hypothetical protein
VDRGDTEGKRLEEALHLSNEQISQLLERIEEPQSAAKSRTRQAAKGMTLSVTLSRFAEALWSPDDLVVT